MLCGLNLIVTDISEFQVKILKKKLKPAGKNSAYEVVCEKSKKGQCELWNMSTYQFLVCMIKFRIDIRINCQIQDPSIHINNFSFGNIH